MPEHHPAQGGVPRSLGVVAAGLLVAVLGMPSAVAQSDEPAPPEQGAWEGSITEPSGAETLTEHTFSVSGSVAYESEEPFEYDYVRRVEVRVVEDTTDDFELGDGCPLPEPVPTRPDTDNGFTVSDLHVPCNGRYVVEAEASLAFDDEETHTLRRSFVIGVAPGAVTGLEATLDGQARAATVTFEPLADGDIAPDAVGYVVERKGPSGSPFRDVGTIGLDDEPRFVDPLTDAPAGDYTYRVLAVRAGADGEVRSTEGAESDTITVEGEPAPSTSAPTTTTRREDTAAPRSTSGGRVSIPRTTSPPRPTTPTTLDTGFEDTLDYGERPDGGDGVEELAGDEPVAGQSIVQDEGESVDLAVPAAGALVMLGWAGHILYLNRLAKQL